MSLVDKFIIYFLLVLYMKIESFKVPQVLYHGSKDPYLTKDRLVENRINSIRKGLLFS